MKKIILVYDPNNGCTMPAGKIKNSVSAYLMAYQRDGNFKSSYGDFAIIDEFLRQANELGVSFDCIELIYRFGDVDKEITINSPN